MPGKPTQTHLLLGAAAAGLTHAGFSLYWALGGRWLLPTVGQWAVNGAREAPVAAGLLLVAVAAVKCAVVIIPLVGPLPRPGLWRAFAWLAAVVLTGYGALNTIVAWLVLGGAVRPEGGFDRQAMIGHAYLWDPLFLVWGILLGAGLFIGGRDRRNRAAEPIGEVALRPVDDSDLDALFEQMRDPESVRMAAFVARNPDDRPAFDAHMAKIRASPEVTIRAVTVDGRLAGTVGSFAVDGETEVTYWIDRSCWGRGIAGRALALLLESVRVRPLFARAATDNMRSLRVLQRAGFAIIGTEVAFAAARNAEIEETILRLDGSSGRPPAPDAGHEA
ncbi:GNAT family N-acetyltransferase [Dactylosporangium salmoneum]|uniref:N-acetyltransferase domain-containing protein n=1 Tax=Dactylosporangium salmoneum TaxID=53361 RepID=A0ABP5U8R6_9ACTN